MLSMINGDEIRTRLRIGSVTHTVIATQNPLVANEFAHLAVTFDGSSVRIYKNAIEIHAQSIAGSLNATRDFPLDIGNNSSSLSQGFNGVIDDVRIFGLALTHSDIVDLAQIPPGCGDGIIQDDLNESCDDTNVSNGDGCGSDCSIEDGWTCSGEPSICQPPVTQCNDGIDNDGDGFCRLPL